MVDESPYNRVVQKLEREWERTQEKAEAAKKGLEDEFRKFFKQHKQQLAKEALENIRMVPTGNPFKNLRGQDGGTFGGFVDITGYSTEINKNEE